MAVPYITEKQALKLIKETSGNSGSSDKKVVEFNAPDYISTAVMLQVLYLISASQVSSGYSIEDIPNLNIKFDEVDEVVFKGDYIIEGEPEPFTINIHLHKEGGIGSALGYVCNLFWSNGNFIKNILFGVSSSAEDVFDRFTYCISIPTID